jgi:ferritin
MSESAQTPMKSEVRDALNEQIKQEFYSFYLYLSMAGSFEVADLPGFAHWMRKQSEEEREHAMKFFDFLLEITSRIHKLYELSVRENDYPAQVFLNWFVTEQVEEEKTATEVVERLRMAGEDGAALLLLDKELGER